MLENNLINTTIVEFSVTELSSMIKQLLEGNFNYVRVRGEISSLKIASSGHVYFSLKDQNNVLAATCWRHIVTNLNFQPIEGLAIVATGRITAYAGQSKYQISVSRIEPAGTGAFMQILMERRERLKQEGLFDIEHKQKPPFFPKKIGIITSISGAVIKDIIHRISDRFPTHLCIWSASVQGSNAAGEIIEAINGFNKLDNKPDLIIIARGGGSIEDLWAFNEENVVRAAYASKIPIISAIGHETDYTLLDLVADVRAPTPTAAAEFATPVAKDIRYTLNNLVNNIINRTQQLLRYYYQLLASHSRIFQSSYSYLTYLIQKTDELGFKLESSLPDFINTKSNNLKYFPVQRLKPAKILHYKTLQLQSDNNNLYNKKSILLKKFTHLLELNTALLSSLDYRNVLKRGFVIIKDREGHYLSSAKEAANHTSFQVKFYDGEIIIDPQ